MKEGNKKRILCEGLKGLMQERPLKNISVRDIVRVSGQSRSVFYYYFRDKYELLNEVCYQDIIIPFAKDLTAENLNDKFLQMLETVKKDAVFYQNALDNPYSMEFKQFVIQSFTEVFEDMAERAETDGMVYFSDRHFTAEFFTYCIGGMLLHHMSGNAETPDMLSEEFFSLAENRRKLLFENVAMKI